MKKEYYSQSQKSFWQPVFSTKNFLQKHKPEIKKGCFFVFKWILGLLSVHKIRYFLNIKAHW